jgi:septal ring factor EnvC (AmiA/AmiB activator)
MKRFAIVLASCLSTSPAFAQQSPQQSPTQLALQINGIIGQMAQGLEALQQQNAELQKQLAAVTKERDELKARVDHK